MIINFGKHRGNGMVGKWISHNLKKNHSFLCILFPVHCTANSNISTYKSRPNQLLRHNRYRSADLAGVTTAKGVILSQEHSNPSPWQAIRLPITHHHGRIQWGENGAMARLRLWNHDFALPKRCRKLLCSVACKNRLLWRVCSHPKRYPSISKYRSAPIKTFR